jgi:hypothetical protein
VFPTHFVHAFLPMSQIVLLLVATSALQDLLLCAKHLFLAAIADSAAARPQPCDLRRRCGRKRLSAEGNKPGQGLGGEPGQGLS